MDNAPFQFPVIAPLIARHAEDAAFYWSQIDRAAFSPQFGFDKLRHFNRLQDAHLDGLIVAGTNGWPPALRALERWRKAGEAFVCALLALQTADQARLDMTLAVVRQRPDELLRGLVSALAWGGNQSDQVIHLWSDVKADPVAQVAALRAAAIRGAQGVTHLASPVSAYFSSTSPHVRAAACRASAAAADADASSRLVAALADDDLAVRAEAAIALATRNPSDAVYSVLKECVLAQAVLQAGATGWYRMQLARRLRRWTMKLALLTMPGAATAAQDLLTRLPPRSALTFAMAHGDLVHLPFVVEQMANPEVDRYAGWVWQTLTGKDLTHAGWTLANPETIAEDADQGITTTRVDADNGLARPLHAAIRDYTASSPFAALHGKRVLCGRVLDPRHALDLLERAPQAVRLLAANQFAYTDSMIRIIVRAPAQQQEEAMRALHDMLDKRVAA